MSDTDDTDAIERIEIHHAIMARQFDLLLQNMIDAAGSGGAASARHSLASWCQDVLLPHAHAEEQEIYPAGHQLPETTALVAELRADHAVIAQLTEKLVAADDETQAASLGRQLQALLTTHLVRENELLLPLAEAPTHDLARMVEVIDELVGEVLHAGSSTHSGLIDPLQKGQLNERAAPDR